MIQKKSWIFGSDNTNVRWLRIFHLYKGFFKKSSSIGFFLKGSARVVEPPIIEYKGFKVKFNKKGDICRGFFIRSKYNDLKKDGSALFFKKNSLVLIKKKTRFKIKVFVRSGY